MNNAIYRVGISWYVRQANTAQWINGRAVRNDLHFSTKREALTYLKTGERCGCLGPTDVWHAAYCPDAYDGLRGHVS